MQFLTLKSKLKDFSVVSITDIEKIDPTFHKQRLSEWQKKAYVKKMRQGFYLFSDTPVDETMLFVVANRIYTPSYVSLEMALSIYGIIPEAVYTITSVTSLHTKEIRNAIGNFSYSHLQPHMMFGYEIRKNQGHSYQIAELEKAVLDFLHLHPEIKDAASFDGMRFNTDELRKKIDRQKFNRYTEAFNSVSLTRRARKFLTYMQNNA